jgi:hypothetical protein
MSRLLPLLQRWANWKTVTLLAVLLLLFNLVILPAVAGPAEAGYTLHAALTITQLLDHWEKTGKVERERLIQTRLFLQEMKNRD